MILVDANLLLYAANHAAPEHDRAKGWLDAQLSGTARVGLPWPSLLAFVRIATSTVAMRSPVTTAQAWRQVEAWLQAPPAWVPAPTERHAEVMRDLLDAPWMTSRLVPDAHLAALAIEHGLTLCSADGDFARFAGLTFMNPLAA
jgi:toxin-antitoxin system PIN domain toxin